VKETQVYEWHKRFHDGHASVNPLCRQPLILTNDEHTEGERNVVQTDLWNCIQDIWVEVGISVESIYRILPSNCKSDDRTDRGIEN
jgi:hypothetical protein